MLLLLSDLTAEAARLVSDGGAGGRGVAAIGAYCHGALLAGFPAPASLRRLPATLINSVWTAMTGQSLSGLRRGAQLVKALAELRILRVIHVGAVPVLSPFLRCHPAWSSPVELKFSARNNSPEVCHYAVFNLLIDNRIRTHVPADFIIASEQIKCMMDQTPVTADAFHANWGIVSHMPFFFGNAFLLTSAPVKLEFPMLSDGQRMIYILGFGVIAPRMSQKMWWRSMISSHGMLVVEDVAALLADNSA